MVAISNKYASKIFSEHPIAIWSLDDDASYVSLIQDNQRIFSDASKWSNTNCTISIASQGDLPKEPSPLEQQSGYYKITGNHQVLRLSNNFIKTISIFDINKNSIENNLETFSVNLYLYQDSILVSSYEIGISYYDAQLSQNVEISKTFNARKSLGWIRLQETFNKNDINANTFKIFLKINTKPTPTSGENQYNFIVNGLSIGQWSEEFSSTTLGTFPQALPLSEEIDSSLNGIPAQQYGPLFDNGYYVVEDNFLLSRNDGVPIIFGSENSTSLYASENLNPSIIFPTKGFLSEQGKYKLYSLEFWMRIRPNTKNDRRIFGPLNSSDGLYVSEGFLTLVINNKFQSYNVSEWYRPMLVHLIYSSSSAKVFINGEQVIDLVLEDSDINFSNNEWMGFYSYQDIKNFEIDCISIFPYLVPLQVAKRRFVWGLGTASQETIDSSFSGFTTAISFPNANYSSNIVYPDKENWGSAYYNNLVATSTSLSVPEYSLPEIFLSGRDSDLWLQDNKTINDSEYPNQNHPYFITFRPNQKTRINLIPNPSFQVDTSGWTASNATITRITTDSFVGDSCVLVNKNASVNGRIRTISTTGNRIPVTAGQKYWFSAYVKVPQGQPSCSLRIRTTEWRSDGTRNSDQVSLTTIVSSSDGWVRLSYSDTPTAGTLPTVSMTFEIEEITANACTYLVDAAIVEQAAQLLPYFDGSYSSPEAKPISYGWLGTPNQSQSQLVTWSTEGINWTEKSYLKFSNANIANAPVSAMYGVFEIEDDLSETRPLIHIVNTLTNKRFEINIENYDVSYSFDGTDLYSVDTAGQEHVIVGIDIPTISNNYDLFSFFSSIESLQIFVGGAPDTTTTEYQTFEGKIYKVAFSDYTNFSKIKNHFNEDGFAIFDDESFFFDHYSTYAVMPFDRYNNFFLDISVSASWEQYYPLSYFAQYAYNSTGDLQYMLDFLQFNIGYPSYTVKTIETVQGSPEFDYDEFENFFMYPVVKSYEFIENFGFSGYQTYGDLESNTITVVNIDESQSSMNIFATFQLISEGANEPIESFPYTRELSNNLIIDAGLENTNTDPYKAYKTLFRLIDGTIIYPPKNIKFDQLALVLYFEIKQDGILSKPLKIRDMEIVSKALNATGPNSIGTKFASNIYPYIKTNIYYDYKSKNPVLINKRNTPYLYLTESTGIKVLTNNDIYKEYAVAVPINPKRNTDFYISALQLFLKYDPNSLMQNTFPIFEIESRNSVVEFMAEQQDDLNRYKIFARNKNTKEIYENIVFYQNGISVQNPFIVEDKWSVISVLFDIENILDFSQTTGSLNIFSGCNFDNISVYQSKGLNEVSSSVARLWQNVLSKNETEYYQWSYWYDQDGELDEKNKWLAVYFSNLERKYLIDSSFIYSSYIGTNIQSVDDDQGINILDDDFISYSEVSWSNIVDKPA